MRPISQSPLPRAAHKTQSRWRSVNTGWGARSNRRTDHTLRAPSKANTPTQLRQRQHVERHRMTGGIDERARTTRFARNVGRNRKAVADALFAAQCEHAAVVRGQRDHVGNARPDETGAGDVTGAVDRIGYAKRIGIVIIRPSVGVIVHTDRLAGASTDIDMMRQGEKFEAHRCADGTEGMGEIVRRRGGREASDEIFCDRAHAHRAPTRPRAAPQVAVTPANAPSTLASGPRSVSQAKRQPISKKHAFIEACLTQRYHATRTVSNIMRIYCASTLVEGRSDSDVFPEAFPP